MPSPDLMLLTEPCLGFQVLQQAQEASVRRREDPWHPGPAPAEDPAYPCLDGGVGMTFQALLPLMGLALHPSTAQGVLPGTPNVGFTALGTCTIRGLGLPPLRSLPGRGCAW